MISRGAVEFQSTLPRRERRYTIYLYQISTLYFNPRSREGSDATTAIRCTRGSVFQSTLPRRERRGKRDGKIRHGKNFNPRSREGSDKIENGKVTILGDFNPRSREGSDVAVCVTHTRDKLFQSTLPRRERPITRTYIVYFVGFQSTLPRRERHVRSVRACTVY